MDEFMYGINTGFNELQALIDIGIAGYVASLAVVGVVGAVSAYSALFSRREQKKETKTLPLRRKPVRESSLDKVA